MCWRRPSVSLLADFPILCTIFQFIAILNVVLRMTFVHSAEYGWLVSLKYSAATAAKNSLHLSLILCHEKLSPLPFQPPLCPSKFFLFVFFGYKHIKSKSRFKSFQKFICKVFYSKLKESLPCLYNANVNVFVFCECVGVVVSRSLSQLMYNLNI